MRDLLSSYKDSMPVAGHALIYRGRRSFHASLTTLVFVTRLEPRTIFTHVILTPGYCCDSHYQELSLVLDFINVSCP